MADDLHIITTQLAAGREPDRWERRVVEKPLDPAKVGANLATFIGQIKTMFSVAEGKQLGEFQLEELSFAAELGPDGDFRLVGTGAAEVAGGIRFTLKRKHTLETMDFLRILVGTEPKDAPKDNEMKVKDYVRGESDGSPVEVHVTGTVPVFENNVPLPVVVAGT